jgi:hypothetical protein
MHIWQTVAIEAGAFMLAVPLGILAERQGRSGWCNMPSGKVPVGIERGPGSSPYRNGPYLAVTGAPNLVRRAAFLGIFSALSNAAVVHFGIAYFEYHWSSSALECIGAFWYAACHAWPLAFLPWAGWLLWVCVGVFGASNRAARRARWTGLVHSIVSCSMLLLVAEGSYLGGYYHRHGSASHERDYIPGLQVIFVVVAILGLVSGQMLSATKRALPS